MTVAAMPCSRRTSRRGRSGQEWRSLACLDAALEAAEDGHVSRLQVQGNTTPQRVACLDSCHTRLASAEQHQTRREDDGIGYQNYELPRGQLANAAERQLRAIPVVHEEQHVDVLQVIPHPLRRCTPQQQSAPESFHPAILALLPLRRMVGVGGIGILDLLHNTNDSRRRMFEFPSL